MFTRDLIQAVNDWQRGGSHSQKVKRGLRLKECVADFPERFRTCELPCFRQEAHEKDRVWQLLADDHLPETIAAWTTDIAVAKDIKGGVPPEGLQGVIFRIEPTESSVVANLNAFYAEPDFVSSIEKHRSEINGFHDGIGRWGNSQREVVLEQSSLDQAAIYSYGGYTSNRETLIELHYQRAATAEDLAEFDRLARQANVVAPGPWWLSQSGTEALMTRMQPHIERLKIKKRIELASKK